jgi:hypothetical protein
MTADTDAPPLRPPGLLKLVLEARAPFEFAASLLAAPWLLERAPRRWASRCSSTPVSWPRTSAPGRCAGCCARWVTTLHGWQQGRNVGRAWRHPRARAAAPAPRPASHGQRPQVSAWSAGASVRLYARELAKLAPDTRALSSSRSAARSPASLQRQPTPGALYQWLHRHPRSAPPPMHDELTGAAAAALHLHLQPQRRRRRLAVQRAAPPAPQAESIEVPASHAGLGVNPLALYALADRLAQPEGATGGRSSARGAMAAPVPRPAGRTL